MLTVTAAQRRFLRARAHALQPTAMIGSAGLTPALLKEIERALAKHELIKIRSLTGDRDQRETMLNELAEQLSAAPVQHIGKILVLYRPAQKAMLQLPSS
jgi:RNA-binding protein